MTPRADFLAILLKNRRRMDAERREFARRAVDVVARNSRGEAFDVMAYALSMREIDELMGIWYGRWPNDEAARFWQLILAECRSARVLAFRRAVEDVRRRLKREPVLLRAIQEAA